MAEKTFAIPVTTPYMHDLDAQHTLLKYWEDFRMLRGLPQAISTKLTKEVDEQGVEFHVTY